jgi:TonB family protein
MIAVAVIAATSTPASAAEPLQPTSKWNVDYDTAQCTAARNYGTEDKPLLLILKPSPFGGVMRLLVVRKGRFSWPATEIRATLRFDEQAPSKANALKFSSEDKRLTVYSVNLPMEDFKARQLAKSISLTTDGLDVTFALDFVPALLKELEKCRADLLEMYNSDQSRAGQVATPIKPLAKIYSPGDYPTDAVRKEDQGTVDLSLLIDETGKVVDCSVHSTAGVATLDTMSCYVIQQRAKFRPAIGTDGKPVRSVFFQRIRWEFRP